MAHRFILFAVLLPLLVAQRDVSVPPGANARLTFSPDGRFLYAIGTSAMTYDVNSGRLLNRTALKPGTQILSIASNGKTAVLAERDSGTRVHLMFLDLATRKLEAVPSPWYEPEAGDPVAALSADSKLFSIYSESGPADRPMTVTVYDRSNGKFVAKQTSEWISAGGGFGGGITPDGAIEFVNNRVGRKVVDLKTGLLMGLFGFASVRSADGRWVVEFPNRSWNESVSKDVLIKDGRNGAVIGKLDLQIPDDETYGSILGTFCGTSRRFVVGRRQSVTVHSIPSGAMIANLPAMSWQDNSANPRYLVNAACSATGTHATVLSGNRLTLHDVP